jgi:beta-ureidopropionase / N-carbamoyl-L-amino-acid hydrolase
VPGPAKPHHDLRINSKRLLDRIMTLGAIGPIRGENGEPGSARLALTDEDRLGRDLVVSWMNDLGLDVAVDVIGNVVATTRWGSGAPVMTGSHIDTVRTGGLYDGNLGVLGGLEVIETLAEHGLTTDRPLAVAFFTDEEGARFQPDMLGSLVFVGGMAVEEALDIKAIDGPTVGDELMRIGYAGSYPCPAQTPHAFVELHVEQGPVLEAEGFTIGVVNGVQGISWQELTITGQSNHAGTTPMRLRHDPVWPASMIGVEVRSIAKSFPNLVNVVAARVSMTVDLRNTDEQLLQDAEARLRAFCGTIADEEGVTITTRPLARFEPVTFDDDVVDLVEATATRLGYSTKRMPSGAGHDAQMLARICPTAMIFTPSVRGISHNPAEHTDPADLEAGTNVLLHVMLQLANATPKVAG